MNQSTSPEMGRSLVVTILRKKCRFLYGYTSISEYMWIYILKIRDENPFNDYHKIGISGNVNERVEYIRKSMKESGLRASIQVRHKSYIIGAYFLEQALHKILRRKQKRMPVTVSGYTEFFDLNFLNILPIIWVIMLIEYCQFLLLLQTILWVISLIIN